MKPAPLTAVVISSVADGRLDAFMARWQAASLGVRLVVYPAAVRPNGMDGCYVSHQAVLAEASGPVLVLEDDAVFAPGCTLDLAYPDDADLFYLGGEHIDVPRKTAAPGIVSTRRIRRTHAYIAWQPSEIARQLPGPRASDVTRMISYALLSLPLRRYAVDPFTVGQAAGVSSIDGEDKPERWWQPFQPRPPSMREERLARLRLPPAERSVVARPVRSRGREATPGSVST